jgi:hypothetical protein
VEHAGTMDSIEENISHPDHSGNSFMEWHQNPYACYNALVEKFYMKNHSMPKISSLE